MAFDDPNAADPAGSQDTPNLADPSQRHPLEKWIDAPNIADDLDDNLLAQIGDRVRREYDIDENSRADWKQKIEGSIELAMQMAKEKQYPWPKAANVIYPLMSTAAMQFAARAYPAIITSRGVVKGIVIGPDSGMPEMGQGGQPLIDPMTQQPIWKVQPGEKTMRAARIADHMSWQCLDEMTEWESEVDILLHAVPITGCMFKKTYFDPSKGRNVSLTLSPLHVVINYRAKSMETAPRITEEIEFYPLEIIEMERAGIWRHIEYTQENDASSGDDQDAPRKFLEQHRYWDLDNDGYPEPYIVTIHKDTSQVVRIKARYDEDGVRFDRKSHRVSKIDPIHYYTRFDFLPNPDGGIYGLGFGTLLRPINEAINTSLNQLLDAGHIANVGGGFIGRGLMMQQGAVRFSPGEYKMVNVPGTTIKENIVPLQFPGPSTVLFQLLGLLIEAGKDIAAVKDVLTGEQQQHNVPATTTLALIEQGLKVFSGIYKRIYRALKEEFRKLYRLNGIYLEEMSSYRSGNDWKQITRQDYAAGSGVEPISDPNMVSDTQKLGRAQFLMQFANDPTFNGMAIRKRILEAAQIEKIEELLQPPPPNPAIMMKGMELDIKNRRERAAEIRDIAQAVLYIAQADQAVGDQHLAWVNQQLEAYKAQFEAAQAGAEAAQGQEGQPGPPQAIPHPSGPPPMPSNMHPGATPAPAGPESGPTSPIAPQVQSQLTQAGMPTAGPPLNHAAHAAWRKK